MHSANNAPARTKLFSLLVLAEAVGTKLTCMHQLSTSTKATPPDLKSNIRIVQSSWQVMIFKLISCGRPGLLSVYSSICSSRTAQKVQAVPVASGLHPTIQLDVLYCWLVEPCKRSILCTGMSLTQIEARLLKRLPLSSFLLGNQLLQADVKRPAMSRMHAHAPKALTLAESM